MWLPAAALYKTEYMFYAPSAQEYSFIQSVSLSLRAREALVPEESVTMYDHLRSAISDRYAALPRQLQRVAVVALERPHDVALKTVAALADDAGVQPSTLVRFANAMGFRGFSAMQQIFRSHLVESSSYRQRIARMRAHTKNGGTRPEDILRGLVDDSTKALEHLPHAIPKGLFNAAVRLVSNARQVDVLAYKRSFPVACYLAYALAQLELSAHLLNGVGGMNGVYAGRLTRSDALIVVSFRNYTPEAIEITAACHARGVPVLAITDGPLSPFKKLAGICLEIGDDGRQPFRSLVEPICLAQALIISVGHRIDERSNAKRRTH
jgi:DNA-binding MurR/RpiR family transcriptional regulator